MRQQFLQLLEGVVKRSGRGWFGRSKQVWRRLCVCSWTVPEELWEGFTDESGLAGQVVGCPGNLNLNLSGVGLFGQRGVVPFVCERRPGIQRDVRRGAARLNYEYLRTFVRH